VREPREGSALHAILFIVLTLVFAAARKKIAAWKKAGVHSSEALLVFTRPYSAALASALLIATSPFFQVSNPVRQLMTLAALVPMLRLSQPTASPAVAAAFYTVCALFAVETVRQAYGGIQVIGQSILVAETLAALVAIFSMRRYYRQILAARAESSHLIMLRAARFLIMVVLVFSLIAGAAGYVRLARLLTPGVLVGGVLALAAYVYLRVVGGVIALAFCVWPLRLLRIVEIHRELLESRVYRLLIWMSVLGWTTRYLAYLGLLDTAWSLGHAALTSKIERGTISISVGNVLEFLLVVLSAYLLSRFLRFVLQEDVYPRIDLAPGMSYAVSSLLNYIVLALGFIAGLGVLGVDFSKVTIMAGAFGVGIGFGLQSIVNNFVSGLILLFERPIHVGDTVEVGNLQGIVRRIGIRASVIHTGAGADIIVPNSQLVTDRVTNWTFSDRLRRVDLAVGVNYGADPKKVIELLERAARANPDVLQDPPPRALLIGYGDSSINFELRVWPRQFNQAAQVKSDLAAAVYEAVTAAGMSFPFPQREIRVLSDHDAAAASPIRGSEKKAQK
jgi:small-conductance mechanosensitive channel